MPSLQFAEDLVIETKGTEIKQRFCLAHPWHKFKSTPLRGVGVASPTSVDGQRQHPPSVSYLWMRMLIVGEVEAPGNRENGSSAQHFNSKSPTSSMNGL